MTYIDIHTHDRQPHEGVTAVVSVHPDDDWTGLQHVSVGVHPWRVSERWREEVDAVRHAVGRNEVVAVGECGLDRVRGGDWTQQVSCFEAQLQLADELGKPVILHCVRAADALLPMVRGWCGRMIWHGFRGKPQQAEQLLRAGIELSFGPQFNADSLRMAYEERKMWLETDDSRISIREIYERASRALSISPTDIELPGTLWS